jgi:hypothetical protein
MTNDHKTTPEPTEAPALDAWQMATSILVGLRKAEARAEAELVSNRAAANQNPFAGGVLSSVVLQRIIRDTLKSLDADLRQHARSNRLAMPQHKVAPA